MTTNDTARVEAHPELEAFVRMIAGLQWGYGDHGEHEWPISVGDLVDGANSVLARLTDPDFVRVPKVATEAQWGGLARHLIMWMDMHPKTPRALFLHLKDSGVEVPDWLRNEPEMQHLDHVPSKGTRAVLIYRAMIAAAGEG